MCRNRTATWILAATLLLPAAGFAARPQAPKEAATPEAASVLIVVNKAVPSQEGTDGMGASEWVGFSYAEKRGVPKRNIVELDIPNTEDPLAWDSWHIAPDPFEQWVRKPIVKQLEKLEQEQRPAIRYIVTTFGVPSHVNIDNQGYSLDARLTLVRTDIQQPIHNPYQNAGVHFVDWNPRALGGAPMYLVTRLDGPTPQVAVGLVDKAIAAEQTVNQSSGIAYIDARGLGCCDGYYKADQSMYRMRDLAEAAGVRVVFDDQEALIQDAPDALWAWGWYGSPTDAYKFVEGAVGAQLTSYTAGSLRYPYQGNWVEQWLRDGITATWGATSEPTTEGYAKGDDFFRAFWSGYNFAESSYLASPTLNHMMVFVGDPLYAPVAFRNAGDLHPERDRTRPRTPRQE